MPFTKRSLEGYLMVDHRAGYGLGSMRGLVEQAVATCSHCQRGVVRNPGRTRERAWCPKCDHYICDECEVVRVASGGACKTWKQIMDEQEKRVLTASQETTNG